MKGSPKDDIIPAKNILHLAAKGHFFDQNWAQVPEHDKQIIELVKQDHHHHVILEEDSWRGMKKCCPIISGGLNPTKLKPFIEIMGETNFITTMGAGVHAHPKGTNAGAKALVQACEAYQRGIDMNEYAKNHKELAESIKFFTKNKKQIKEAESVERS
jgi:ribulose-bisphosphate carboxylase large chain